MQTSRERGIKQIKIKLFEHRLGRSGAKKNIHAEDRESLRKGLLKKGLELMDDKKSMLIEKTKNIIIELIHYSEKYPKVNFSEYLSAELDYNYTHLATLFS